MGRSKFQKILLVTLRYLIQSGPVQTFLAYTKRVALPGFDNMPIYNVAEFFITGIQKGGIVTRAPISFIKTVCYHASNNGIETHFQ